MVFRRWDFLATMSIGILHRCLMILGEMCVLYIYIYIWNMYILYIHMIFMHIESFSCEIRLLDYILLICVHSLTSDPGFEC